MKKSVQLNANEGTVFGIIPLAKIRPYAGQPRTYFDPDVIAGTASSIKENGQTTPVIVEVINGDPIHDYELIDGETRYRSALEAGESEVAAIIRPFGLFKSDDEKHLVSFTSNYNRTELTPMDLSNALRRQVDSGRTQSELAVLLGMNQMTVSNYLQLQKLHQELQARLHPKMPRDQHIAPNTGFLLAKVPLRRQLEVAKKASDSRGHITTASVEFAIRKMGIQVDVRKREPNPTHRRRKIESAIHVLDHSVTNLRNAKAEDIVTYARNLGTKEREGLAKKLSDAAGDLHGVITIVAGGDPSLLIKFGDRSLPMTFKLEQWLLGYIYTADTRRSG